MKWNELLALAGVTDLDTEIHGINEVTDTIVPEHTERSSHEEVDENGDTRIVEDVAVVEARYEPISIRINSSKKFNTNDSIVYIAIEKCGNDITVFGLRHAVAKDGVSYIAKYDEVL